MTIWYLNNSDEPENEECDNPDTLALDRVELTKRILKEGVFLEKFWIPPHRILRLDL